MMYALICISSFKIRTMFLPREVYHVYNRANGYENLFRQEKNFLYFLMLVKRHVSPYAEVYAWCLLDNHFHFMIETKADEKGEYANMSQKFSNLFNAYAKAFNKVYHRRGSLFQKQFKYKLVDSERYMMRLVLYIHKNAFKHGMVRHFKDWPFSSWFEYAHFMGGGTQVVDRFGLVRDDAKKKVLGWFGGAEAFAGAHENAADAIEDKLPELS